jgi:hypothetical protein
VRRRDMPFARGSPPTPVVRHPQLDYHLPSLRWVDAAHMDERSAAIVAQQNGWDFGQARRQDRLRLHSYWVFRGPPAATITAMMTRPVTSSRTPALTPKVLSMVSNITRNNEAPQTPVTLALPPATEVPPITTTAIEVSRYSLPISSEVPRKQPASSAPHSPPSAPLSAT